MGCVKDFCRGEFEVTMFAIGYFPSLDSQAGVMVMIHCG